MDWIVEERMRMKKGWMNGTNKWGWMTGMNKWGWMNGTNKWGWMNGMNKWGWMNGMNKWGWMNEHWTLTWIGCRSAIWASGTSIWIPRSAPMASAVLIVS